MAGNLTFEALKAAVKDGETSFKETHCCNYLLATDLEMATPEGYAASSWEQGYGDYVMAPDLTTIRVLPWLEGTAMVLCDILDHHTHAPVPHAPRQILKTQIARLKELGFDAMMATELEFFLFEGSVDDIRKSGFRDLTPISGYNEDYHIMQTTKEEGVMRPIRNPSHDCKERDQGNRMATRPCRDVPAQMGSGKGRVVLTRASIALERWRTCVL